MSLSWKLSLEDKVSAPAAKATKALSSLEGRLRSLRDEDARQSRLGAAVAKQVAGFQRVTSAVDKQTRAMRALAAAKALATGARDVGGRIAKGPIGDIGGSIVQSGVAAGAALGAAAIGGTFKLGSMIADAQEFKASTMFALKTTLGTQSAAEAAFAKAQATAMLVGGDFRETMSGFTTLVAQGFDANFADQLVRAMADLKTMNPKANMEGITRAISQIKSTGKLQGDELMQLAEAGLNVEKVYAQIAQQMGVVGKDGKTANQVVQDLQKAGKISSDVAIAAIMGSLKNQVGGKEFGTTAAAKADQSMAGAAARAMAMREAFLSTVQVDWSPISRSVAKVMEVMQGPAGDRLSKSLGDGFSKMLSVLDNVKTSDIEGFIDGAAEAFTVFSDVVVIVADGIGRLANVYKEANAAFEDSKGISLASAVLGGFANSVYAAMFVITHSIEMAMATFSELYDVTTSLGGSIMDGIVAGIDGGAAAVVDSLVSAVESAVEAAEDVLGIASPSKVTTKIGYQTGIGPAVGIDKALPAVRAAGLRMAQAPLEAGQRLGQSVFNSSTVNSGRTIHIQNLHAVDPAAAMSAALKVGELQS
jgi:tape measure domain-containing protein